MLPGFRGFDDAPNVDVCLVEEITIRLLSFLSPKELAPCARLSKQFLTIIKTNSILTYALELGKVGLDDTYLLNFWRIENSECNPSDLLAELRKREHGLSTFTWNKHWDTPVGNKLNNLQICGSVITGGCAHRHGEWYQVDTIYVYDLHNVGDNGPAMTTLSLDAVYSGYAVDPGQDLLVLIGKYVPGESFCNLHLRNLSTGLEYKHTKIKQSTLSVRIPDADEWSSRSSVEIFGDNLLVKQHNYKTYDMKIINWRTAQSLTIGSGFGDGCFCTPISQTEILLVCYEETGVPLLRYFTLNEIDTGSLELQSHVAFDLPFKNNPLSNQPGTWVASTIFSEASYTPKEFSPFFERSTFVYPQNSGMVGIKFQNTQPTLFFLNGTHEPGRLPYTFDMFIHLNSLRKLKDMFSSSPLSNPVTNVPWEAWGPGITRVLQDTYLGVWHSRTLRGYRFLAPDTSEYQIWEELTKLDFKILDFNANAWDSSTSQGVVRGESEVLTCDGIRITSSLPYREIRMSTPRSSKKYRSNRFGIQVSNPFSILMGDDIVWLDENPSNNLHVFQF